MKNKKYFNMALVVAAIVALTGVTMASASFEGFRGKKAGGDVNFTPSAEKLAQMEERKADMEAHQAEMQTIMDSGDYNAWKAVVEAKQAGRVNVLDVINEDNFDKMIEMHNLKQAGDIEGAKAIAQELGFPDKGDRGMMGHGKRGGRGMNRHVQPEQN